MAESTLSLGYTQFVNRVSVYLGYGPSPTGSILSRVDDFVQSGARQFYFPPPMDLGRGLQVHEWHFMTPLTFLLAWPDYSASTTRLANIAAAAESSEMVVESTDALWRETMVGKTMTFPLIGTGASSTVLRYINDRFMVVTRSVSSLPVTGTQFTIASDANYEMPDDLGGIDQRLTFEPSKGFDGIPITSEHTIRENRQFDQSAARPRLAALRSKPHTDATEGQRKELILWPDCDQEYKLSFRFNVLPPKLSNDNQYPLGGMAHGETVLASCLEVAEREGNDIIRGPHWKNFMDRLRASVAFDSYAGEVPEHLGYNGDLSDSFGKRLTVRDRRDLFDDSIVTLQGGV